MSERGRMLSVIIVSILSILLIVACVLFEVWVLHTYGDKPIDEVPFWVVWFLIK